MTRAQVVPFCAPLLRPGSDWEVVDFVVRAEDDWVVVVRDRFTGDELPIADPEVWAVRRVVLASEWNIRTAGLGLPVLVEGVL